MLRDLAQAASIAPAQAHAYLLSFRKIGLVEQDEASGRYALGPFAMQMGLARMRASHPLRMAGRAAADFAAEMGLMVTVAVWGTHGPTIIQVHESNQPIHVNLRAGSVYTITGTATGRLFAAYLPRTQSAPLLEEELRGGAGVARKVGQAGTAARLEHDIAAIRSLGYSTTEGVPVPGINAVSAPVFDHTGQMQLAITAIGNTGTLDCNPGGPQVEATLALACRLSKDLGMVEPPAEAPLSAPRRGRRRAPADATEAPPRSRTG